MMGLLGGAASLLCMLVPIHLKEGYFLDLRMVPVITSFLYGGWRGGAVNCSMVLLLRFYLGGPGLPGTLFEIFLALVGYLAVTKRFLRWSVPVRVGVAIALSLWLSSTSLSFTWIFHPDVFSSFRFVEIAVQFLLIQCVATWISAYYVEIVWRQKVIREMLEQSKKMQLVSELAASVSHEVRNPLTVTRGFIQLLNRNGLTEEKRTEYIRLALDELDRAESIINDFLSFAKPQLGQLESLHVLQEMRYVADIMMPYASMNHVQISVEADDDIHLEGEKDKFRQCLVNLAKNAIEAMPTGGQLRLTAYKNPHSVTIRMTDTGTGMTQEQINRLGTPYYSTKDKGTGLGTMVVFSMVQAMKGTIRVESNVGSGTSFVLTFKAG